MRLQLRITTGHSYGTISELWVDYPHSKSVGEVAALERHWTWTSHSNENEKVYIWARQAVYVRRNIEMRSRNHCCPGKATSITYSECLFVALGIQECACAILSSVACPALQYFSTLSHKLLDFRNKKNYWTQNVCFDFLYSFCV